MPPIGNIRLGAFCELIGQSRETVRTAIYSARFPVLEWDGDGQRTFDGRDLFAFEVFNALTRDGADQERAAEHVNISYACEKFIEELTQCGDFRDLCLLTEADAELDPDLGFQEDVGARVIRAGKIGDYIAKGLEPRAPYLSMGRDKEAVPLGLSRVTVVPLWSCWKLAQGRATAAGYQLSGNHLLPIGPNAEASE